MGLLFAISLFLAAALAFVVQPLVGRQLLPLAGGAPAVWTTCLVFFQLLLLAGYLYSHLLSRLHYRWGYLIHALLLAGAFSTMLNDTALSPDPALADQVERAPVPALIAGLLNAVGLPYFALATTAPLLQSWFARGGRDPYWLYAASNAGSLLGLLAYPFLIEPYFPIASQRYAWRSAFMGVAVLVIVCGLVVSHWTPQEKASRVVTERISPGRRLKWIGLAALTASLLASVTAHLTTDIAPMPLLWVVPLALYLLTYIVTFTQWPSSARRLIGRLAPMTICFTAVALLTQATEPMLLVAGVHLIGLVLVCLLCHGELAADKPCPSQLTDFYLCIAIGGVLGGAVNAVLAPILFSQLGPVEYPLALVLAALVRPWSAPWPLKAGDMISALGVLLLTLGLGISVPRLLPVPSPEDEGALLLDRVLRGGLMFGVPVAVCFVLVWRPMRFALCLAAVLAAGSLMRTQNGQTLEVSRNFFGTLTVTRSSDGRFTVLTHGNTQHGQQRVGNGDQPHPAMYYHRHGPLGRVFTRPAQRVGVVGLGCGAMAAYAEPGQHWTFYEIDPGVVRIASNPDYFTFIKTCKAQVDIVLGDARRKLEQTPDGTFDLLAIDAFNSDAVPVHLLTCEAFALYLKKLAPNGRLLLHLSNRYLDLPSLAARGLRDLDARLVIRWCEDGEADRRVGKLPSTWLIAARDANDLGKLPLFVPMRPYDGPIWTDDYAPLLGVWKREED